MNQNLSQVTDTITDIIKNFDVLSDDKLIEKLSFVIKNYDYLEDFLSETLTYSLKKNKSKKVVSFIFDELVKLVGDDVGDHNLKYFPITLLIEKGYFEYALKFLELSEDPDCILNGDGWIFLQEGIALYHLKRYQEALEKFNLASNLDDYRDIVTEYEIKIEQERK